MIETYDHADAVLSKELAKLERREFKSLISQVDAEYQLARAYLKPKWDEWGLRLKLYNNQRRDKDAVGDPLMFTIHQTILASLYSDELTHEWAPRAQGDDEVAESLNDLAENDKELMGKDIFDYEFDFDATFYGHAVALMMEFDRQLKCPVPEVWDPMTMLRDPRAVSINGDMKGRGRARFFGREALMTRGDMKQSKVYFNLGQLRKDKDGAKDRLDEATRARAEAQGHDDVLRMHQLTGDNADFNVLQWFTSWRGKRCYVEIANNRKLVVRYQVLPEGAWPALDRLIFPISHDWDGVSIPDLTEDKQRARSIAQNLGLKIVKAGLHPMYIFNRNLIKNKAELNFEPNKAIGVDGNPSGAVAEVPRAGLKQEVATIMEILDTAAQRATATPEIQQGAVGDRTRTATELSLVERKVSTRYSLSAKIFGWSEKRFWKQWYSLYKRHFKESIDEKSIRISGPMGPKWRKLTRENIIATEDPDVKIESRAISEARRISQLQGFTGFAQLVMQDPEANQRETLRHLAKLNGVRREVVDRLLPPSFDELTAEDENKRLDENKIVAVAPTDNHQAHLAIHTKASDTPATYAHIQAHKKAMLVKRANPGLIPELPGVMPTNIAPQKVDQTDNALPMA